MGSVLDGSGWDAVPPELMEAVVELLPPDDKASARQACRLIPDRRAEFW
jgi:hypothetical protein